MSEIPPIVQCQRCHAMVPTALPACPSCGAPHAYSEAAKGQRCPYCEYSNPPLMSKCLQCGESLMPSKALPQGIETSLVGCKTVRKDRDSATLAWQVMLTNGGPKVVLNLTLNFCDSTENMLSRVEKRDLALAHGQALLVNGQHELPAAAEKDVRKIKVSLSNIRYD